MIMKSVLAIMLSVAMASAALAAGSTSPSRAPRPSPPTGYDKGVEAVKAGDYARALALLQKVVVANPRNANALIPFSFR